MDSAYGQSYRDLYQNHWWWRARERFILQTLESTLPAPGRHSILDVGCGDGLFFRSLSRFGDVEGIEVDGTLVNDSNPWKHKVHVGAFDHTFQPGKAYSLILMLDALEHFSDPLPALHRANDLLDPTGALVITVPAFRCLWTTHDDLNHHFTRYTKRSLTELLRTAGIRIRCCRYFFHWAFPLKLLTHIKERAPASRATDPQHSSPMAEPNYVPAVVSGTEGSSRRTRALWQFTYSSGWQRVSERFDTHYSSCKGER